MHELMRMPVKFDEASEVIYDRSSWCGNKFYNTTTKKTGINIDEVKTKNNYIVLQENRSHWGYYAVKSTQYNAVLLVIASLYNGRWNERARFVFFKDKFLSSRQLDAIDVIDMKGQYVRGKDENQGINVPFKGAKILRDFFGGVYFSGDRGKLENTFIFNDARELQLIFSYSNGSNNNRQERHYEDGILFGMQQLNDDGRKIEKTKLPNVFTNRIGSFFNHYMKTYKNKLKEYPNPFNGKIKAAYLQDCNGVPVLRCFICLVKPQETYDSSLPLSIEMREYKRIWMDKPIESDKLNMLDVPLVFYDKTVSGVFKYVKSTLQNAVNTAKRNVESVNVGGRNNTKLKGKSVKIAYILATEPFCEKINNSPYKKIAGEMIQTLQDGFVESARIVMENMFGQIYWDKKALHQMLGVPKEVIEILEKNKILKSSHLIVFLKKIFKDYPEYISGMGHESIERFFSIINNQNFDYVRFHVATTVGKLVTIFGPDNWANYLEYVFNHHVSDSIYAEYLDRIMVLRDMVEGFSWRLEGNELDRANRSIAQAYYAALDKLSYERYSKSFKDQENDWKKYEFNKNGLMITYPKAPSELVMEGIKLNHCAKQFLDIVSEKRTTILFIRKEKNPSKPFYTLEIRNGRVRQCHGHNNITIADNPRLEPFLREFCQQNNIEFSMGKDMLGA